MEKGEITTMNNFVADMAEEGLTMNVKSEVVMERDIPCWRNDNRQGCCQNGGKKPIQHGNIHPSEQKCEDNVTSKVAEKEGFASEEAREARGAMNLNSCAQ